MKTSIARVSRGSIKLAKFELVDDGSGAPSSSYVTPWNPSMTGSSYENRTTPGNVSMTRLMLVFTGRVAISPALIVLTATGVPCTPVEVALALPIVLRGATVNSLTLPVETSTVVSAGPSGVVACKR